MVFIPPKSALVNFLWGKNDVRTAIQQFYTPKNFYTPKQISGYAPEIWMKFWMKLVILDRREMSFWTTYLLDAYLYYFTTVLNA